MILRNEEYGRLMTLGDKGVYVIALLKMLKINKSIRDQLAKMYFTIDSVAQDYLKILEFGNVALQ